MGKHRRDFPLFVDGWMDEGRVESAIITIIDSITLLAFVGFCVFFFRKKVGISSRCWNRVFSIVNTKRQCRSTFTIDHVIARDWLPLNTWISTHIVFFFPSLSLTTLHQCTLWVNHFLSRLYVVNFYRTTTNIYSDLITDKWIYFLFTFSVHGKILIISWDK